MTMDDEKLEEFIERLEKLYEETLSRVAKLEEQLGNPANPPIGLSTPMIVHAPLPSVGFRWLGDLPLRRLDPQL
jgi:hypothetical protein